MIKTLPEKKAYIAVAPMMGWTDRHYRYMARLISPHTHLYTLMLTTGALIHADADRFLRYNTFEQPVALQLGGNDPDELAACARMGEEYGYDEINLNNGCPSDRVQNGNFGACQMENPEHIARCFEKMQQTVDIPVTVKCRIAIDEYDHYSFLYKYIDTISKAGCQKFIVHARKAWLNGLSPAENRTVPPLRYDVVEKIKRDFPELEIIINGGIQTVQQTKACLWGFDGVMIGREAYHNPWILADLEREVWGNHDLMSREDVARAMIPYIAEQHAQFGTPVKSITRHMLNLFKGEKGARSWRQYLTVEAPKNDSDEMVVARALEFMSEKQAQRAAA